MFKIHNTHTWLSHNTVLCPAENNEEASILGVVMLEGHVKEKSSQKRIKKAKQ